MPELPEDNRQHDPGGGTLLLESASVREKLRTLIVAIEKLQGQHLVGQPRAACEGSQFVKVPQCFEVLPGIPGGFSERLQRNRLRLLILEAACFSQNGLAVANDGL